MSSLDDTSSRRSEQKGNRRRNSDYMTNMASPTSNKDSNYHSHETFSTVAASSDATGISSPTSQTRLPPFPHHNETMHSAQDSPERHDSLWSQESRCHLPPISLVSTCEEMNPSKRSSFEDCSMYAPAGTWNAPDENMAFLAIADGHGGRDIVEFCEDGLLYHVCQELQIEEKDPNNDGDDDNVSDDSIHARLERSFLMADIHSKALGLTNSGATVAMCLVTRGNDIYNDITTTNHTNDTNGDENQDNTWKIYAANAGDARIVLGHGGKAHRMTRDHRTDDPEEVRRIEESGGFVFKGRVLGILAVTRSLGDHCMKEYVSNK